MTIAPSSTWGPSSAREGIQSRKIPFFERKRTQIRFSASHRCIDLVYEKDMLIRNSKASARLDFSMLWSSGHSVLYDYNSMRLKRPSFWFLPITGTPVWIDILLVNQVDPKSNSKSTGSPEWDIPTSETPVKANSEIIIAMNKGSSEWISHVGQQGDRVARWGRER